ncbi:MAG: hypothetical protein HYX84_01395 [Chloroflexi bacterium]|nr:hypothetical protein [Chloroflexota bacterium]
MARQRSSFGSIGELRWHRLGCFEIAFDLYIKGQVPASYVQERWRKLQQVGLPEMTQVNRRGR